MPDSTASAPARSDGRLKVFLSYSRKDSTFAAELLSSLELLGFEAFLDKEDIAPGEAWKERLGALIDVADTVVFVLSPNSLASQHCAWEVEETARAAKRLVPVILSEVPNEQVPEALRRLNYVYFSHGRSFAKALTELNQALRANLGWIREHTRLAELAHRWQDRGKPEPLLLRGSDVADALAWLANRPDDAPEIIAVQQAYIEASKAAAEAAVRQQERLRWRVQIGLGLAALASLAAAAVAGWQWRVAEDANIRLSRPIALRVAPLGSEPYDIGSNWYVAATSYTGAVAYLVRNADPGAMFSSGAVLDAKVLNPQWAAEPVFVTAIYAVSKLGSAQGTGSTRQGTAITWSSRPQDVSIVFLGPTGEARLLPLTETIWQSETLGISVNRIGGSLPKGAARLDKVMTSLTALGPFEDSAVIEKSDYVAGPAAFMRSRALAPRALVSAGNMEGRKEVTLLVHHLMGRLRFEEARARRFATDIYYTQASLPGSSGSPVFDVETGQLIGFHLLRESRCAAPRNSGETKEMTDLERSLGSCLGSATSIARIVAGIAARPHAD